MLKVNEKPAGYIYVRKLDDGTLHRNFSFTLKGAESVSNVIEIYALHSADEPLFKIEEADASQ